MFQKIYYVNVNLCVEINAKTNAFKLTLMWQPTWKWHITLVFTTLLNTSNLEMQTRKGLISYYKKKE
jgi:hypothetical protein